ncbi:hypothetical protein HPULCUR_007725 [Helicostylum pulchrum]|uniref:G protein alpha subunit n=1 Tax=Helicostylum pulchrum TaxID=562976 RepID=A0ABP9Y5K8_9FUNG
MGCCSSIQVIDDIGKLRDQEIDDQIKKDRQNMSNQVKLLLLGSGESGKSTLLKQMRIIHEGEFPQEEKISCREIVFSNLIESMKLIVMAMNKLKIPLADEEESKDAYDLMMNLSDDELDYNLPSDIANAIFVLWQDEGVKSAFDRRNEFQLNTDYIPNQQDILRARVKTTGITETKFTVGDLLYRMVDVGGQRSERKKWIHCFEDVTAIIFMVAISEYDQVLFEDETVNRMGESLTLFQSICDMECFQKTSIILFMNKTDLFKKKLNSSPLNAYFPKYKGNTYDQACQYLMEQFQALTVKCSDKRVYTHFTCATDTKQIKFVMAAVNDIILQSTLREVGLI